MESSERTQAFRIRREGSWIVISQSYPRAAMEDEEIWLSEAQAVDLRSKLQLILNPVDLSPLKGPTGPRLYRKVSEK